MSDVMGMVNFFLLYPATVSRVCLTSRLIREGSQWGCILPCSEASLPCVVFNDQVDSLTWGSYISLLLRLESNRATLIKLNPLSKGDYQKRAGTGVTR